MHGGLSLCDINKNKYSVYTRKRFPLEYNIDDKDGRWQPLGIRAKKGVNGSQIWSFGHVVCPLRDIPMYM